MAIRRFVLASLMISGLIASSASAVTVQQEDWLIEGSPVLWLEAETLMENEGTPDDTGFLIVDNINPFITTDQAVKGELPALPEDTNAFGGTAIMDMLGGVFLSDFATYEVEFAYPGRYFLFAHYSMYNRDTNTNYGNEDSIFLPPAFNANPGEDWIGHEGVNAQTGDPKTGDSKRDGWMPLGKTIVSKGEESVHNNVDEEFWDGTFHWGWFEEAVDNDANDAFIDGPGHGIEYHVTEDQVGQTLTFQISAREDYSVLDGFLFSQNKRLLSRNFTQEELTEQVAELITQPELGCDVDGNGVCDANDIDAMSQQVIEGTSTLEDRTNLIESPMTDGFNTWIGDADLNGRFDEQDFVAAFIAGKYLTGGSAGWAEGDWDGNLTFNEQDFVAAFIAGGYLQGERGAAAVPEPSTAVLLALGLLFAVTRRRK